MRPVPKRFAGFGWDRLGPGVMRNLRRACLLLLQRGKFSAGSIALVFAQRPGSGMLRNRRMGLRLRCTGDELLLSFEPVIASLAGGTASVLPDLVGALGD